MDEEDDDIDTVEKEASKMLGSESNLEQAAMNRFGV